MTILLSPHPLREEVRTALAHYDILSLEKSPLASLYAIWPLPASHWNSSLAAPRKGIALLALLERALAQLALRHPQNHALLVSKYFASTAKSTQEIIDALPKSKATFHRNLNSALDALATELARLDTEAEIAFQQRYEVQTTFLPAYTPQFIVGKGTETWDSLLSALRARLSQSRTPILVTGLGGIGKTTLVNESLRIWLQQEEPAITRVLYVRMATGDSTASITLPRAITLTAALTHLLEQIGVQLAISYQAPSNVEARIQQVADYLIAQRKVHHRYVLVVDDIETDIEHAAAVHFAGFVSHLAIVILVSRQVPELGAQNYKIIRVGELPTEDATTLIRTTASRAEVKLQAAEVERILKVVGGHPLALELLIPQLRQISLDDALEDLHDATQMAEVLYRRIYQRAWQLLGKVAQQILIWFTNYPREAIPQGELSNLSELLDLDPKRQRHVISDALRDLRTLNLIQPITQPIAYTLHRLTYQFVLYVTNMNDLWEYDRYDDEPDIDHPV